MIPDHLIEKAARGIWAMETASEWPGSSSIWTATARNQARAALEAVAADIWDQGFKEGRDHGYDFRMAENWDDEYPPEPASPYRHEESA